MEIRKDQTEEEEWREGGKKRGEKMDGWREDGDA